MRVIKRLTITIVTILALASMAAGAAAQSDYVGITPPDAGTVEAGANEGSGSGVRTAGETSALPMTGADIAAFAILGFVLVAGGLVLNRAAARVRSRA